MRSELVLFNLDYAYKNNRPCAGIIQLMTDLRRSGCTVNVVSNILDSAEHDKLERWANKVGVYRWKIQNDPALVRNSIDRSCLYLHGDINKIVSSGYSYKYTYTHSKEIIKCAQFDCYWNEAGECQGAKDKVFPQYGSMCPEYYSC